ncbi:MAG: purine-nucleoside phosphorylase [Planctomycetota bacterium]|nr:purine-nucleoside phosphorylase [Planctomycetota bacterium]
MAKAAAGGLFEKVQEAADAIRTSICPKPPRAAVILGTGLGGLAKQIDKAKDLPYSEIPNFPVSTVKSHAGRVVCGTLGGTPVLAFDGRFHLYEGWNLEQVTLPVRVAKALGAKALFLSGACGGMNPNFAKGDVVLLDDHINMMGVNPLIGPNDDRLGPRFPDMCAPYDKEMLAQAETICLEEKIRAHRAVYVGVLGPCLETRAEYRMLRAVGADVVGMSTVPEVITAVHAGLRVFAASIVTDLCLPDALQPAHIDEIIAAANSAEPKVTKLVARLIGSL